MGRIGWFWGRSRCAETAHNPHGRKRETQRRKRAGGANNTNLGFTGEQTNANGLIYLRARHYDPTTGTFLSRDPVLGAVGGRSIRFNGYAYAGANPVNYVDPSGEFWWFLGLFLLGGGLDVGAQMLFEGKELGEVDMLRAGISGATALIGGGAGFLSGRLIQQAGLTGARALAAGGMAAVVDFGAGVAADHFLLGDSMGTAVFSNVFGFGIGEVLGYGVKGLGRIFRRGARNTADQVMDGARRSVGSPFKGAQYLPQSSGARYLEDNFTPRARELYERIAAWGTDDLDRIASNTGIDRATIETAHTHLFRTEHTWTRGGLTKRGLFTPDETLGALFIAARNGDFSNVRLRDYPGIVLDNADVTFSNLVAHEYIESGIMAARNIPYQHPKSWVWNRRAQEWIYDPSPNAFGAHELAPDWMHGTFSHWENYVGRPYGGPTVTNNLSNINDVLEYILGVMP